MPYNKMRWAVGIITWERPEIFRILMDAMKQCADLTICDKIIVVDDASQDPEKIKLLDEFKETFPGSTVIRASNNGGVAINSNRVLKLLKRFDYGFLMNDDYKVIKTGIFKAYMDAFLATGIHSFQHNPTGTGKRIEYQGVPLIASNKSFGGMITTTKQMLASIGGMDMRVGKFGFEHRFFTLKAKKRGFVGNPNDNAFYDILEGRLKLRRNESTKASTQGKARYKGFADKWQSVKKEFYQPFFGDEIDLDTEEDRVKTVKEKFGNVDSGIVNPALGTFVDNLARQKEVNVGFARSDLSMYGKELRAITSLDLIVDNPNRDLVIQDHRNAFEKTDFSDVKGHENRGWLFFAIATFWGSNFPPKMQKDVMQYLRTTSFHSSRYAWLAFTMMPEPDAKKFFTELLFNKPDLYEQWMIVAAKRLLTVGQLTDFVQQYKLPLRYVPTVVPAQKVKFLRILYSVVVNDLAPHLPQYLKDKVTYSAIKKSPFKSFDDFDRFVQDEIEKESKVAAEKDIENKTFKVEFSQMVSDIKNNEVDGNKKVDEKMLGVLKSGLNLDLGQNTLKFFETVKLVSEQDDAIQNIEMKNGGTNTTFKGMVNGVPMFFKIKKPSQKATSILSAKCSDVMYMFNITHPMMKNIKVDVSQLGDVKTDTGAKAARSRSGVIDVEMAEYVTDYVPCSMLVSPNSKEKQLAKKVIDNLSGESIKKLCIADFITYQQDRFVDNAGVKIKTGEVIPMDNDLSYGYFLSRSILSFMIRELAYDVISPKSEHTFNRDDRLGNWAEKVFIPAFDYRLYGEIGVNYPSEVVKMLDEFYKDEDSTLNSIIPSEGVRTEIVEAIRQNIRNMADLGFETAIMKYKMEILPKVIRR
jgi:hypothetical protein